MVIPNAHQMESRIDGGNDDDVTLTLPDKYTLICS
jgi:hypothetical protein